MRLVFALAMLLFIVGLSVIGLQYFTSPESRAQAAYDDGLARLEAGELDRAELQFREAARLDESFVEPRYQRALLYRSQNRFEPAAAQLIDILDIDPDNGAARLDYAELLFIGGLQDEARAELQKAAALLGETPRVIALDAGLLLAEGETAAAGGRALEAIAGDPALPAPYATLGAIALERQNLSEALGVLARARAAGAEDLPLAVMRLSLLQSFGDTAAIERELAVLSERYPEHPRFALGLADWYLDRVPPDPEAAAAILRGLAQDNADDSVVMAEIVQRLVDMEGLVSARESLAALAAEAEDETRFAREIAALDFASGNKDVAIARLEAAVAAGNNADARNAARLLMGRMLDPLIDAERRKAIAEEVLADDPENMTAYLLRADSYLAEGATELAILDLRAALNSAPDSIEVISKLAVAHYMDGARALAADRLSKAVRLSGYAPDPAIVFARFLLSQGNRQEAVEVLDRALDAHGDRADLLLLRIRVALELGDTARAEALEPNLAAFPDLDAARRDLRIALLAQTGQSADAITLLETDWKAKGSSRALTALGAGYLRTEQPEAALALADAALAERPDWLAALRLSVDAHLAMEDSDEAEQVLAQLVAIDPETPAHAAALARIKLSRGKTDEAEAALETALQSHPGDTDLLLLSGAAAEMRGDPEAAIGAYDRAHEAAPGDLRAANALASMLVDYREDPDSHAQALEAARLLKSAAYPAYRGTYGWALLATGDADGAFPYLRDAATQHPEDPAAQLRFAVLRAATAPPGTANGALEEALDLADGTVFADGPLAERARHALRETDTETPPAPLQ